MTAKVGDRIFITTQRVGQAARVGEILEIIEASYGTRYRVRWDDGHESTIRPAAGSARTTSPAKRDQVKAPGPAAGPGRPKRTARTPKSS